MNNNYNNMKNALNSLNNNNVNVSKSASSEYYQYLTIITLLVGIIPVVLSDDLSMMDQIALISFIVIYSGLQFAQIRKLQKSGDSLLMLTIVVPIVLIVGVVLYIYLLKDETV